MCVSARSISSEKIPDVSRYFWSEQLKHCVAGRCDRRGGGDDIINNSRIAHCMKQG